jgi:hypothetical protein
VLLESILESSGIPVVLVVLGLSAKEATNLVIHEAARGAIHAEGRGLRRLPTE